MTKNRKQQASLALCMALGNLQRARLLLAGERQEEPLIECIQRIARIKETIKDGRETTRD